MQKNSTEQIGFSHINRMILYTQLNNKHDELNINNGDIFLMKVF